MPLWEENNLQHLETLLIAAGYSMMMLAENLRSHYTAEQGRQGQIKKFFRSFYAKNVGVSDLAEELGISESRTIHILLAEFQKGFSLLLAEERLLHVDELLAESKLPLWKIAEMTGFSNEYYLSLVFKKHFGCSPGARRKQLQSQSS